MENESNEVWAEASSDDRKALLSLARIVAESAAEGIIWGTKEKWMHELSARLTHDLPAEAVDDGVSADLVDALEHSLTSLFARRLADVLVCSLAEELAKQLAGTTLLAETGSLLAKGKTSGSSS